MDINELKEDTASTQPIMGIDTKIPLREKLLLPAIGAMCAFFNTLVTFYLSFYYLNYFRMDPNYINSMFAIVQILAAVIAVIFASFIDGRTTRWGKYKPWLLIALIGTALGTMLAFMPPSFGGAGNHVYATITYSIFSIFFYMNLAVRIGMTATMTKRQDDRMEMAIISSLWGFAVSYALSYVALPLLRLFSGAKLTDMSTVPLGDPGMFHMLILVSLVIFAVISIFLIRTLKERFVIPIDRREKVGITLLAKSLFMNKYALIAVLYTLLQGVCTTIKSSTAIYYFKYVVNDTGKMALFILLNTTAMLIGMFFGPAMTKKLGIKKSVTKMLYLNVIASVIAFFIPAGGSFVGIYYALSGIGYFCLGIAMPAHEAMLTAASDYGEWMYKAQGGASIGALSGLMQKIYTSANKLLPFYLLLIGFNLTAKQQTATALSGIKFSATLLPALIFLLLLLIVMRWDMTGERHEKMLKEVWRK